MAAPFRDRRGQPRRRLRLPRLLAAACAAVLLVGCGNITADETEPEATAGSSVPPTEEPTAPDEPSSSPSPESPTDAGAGRVVSNGVRLDRLENTGGRTVASITNLNDLPADVELSIAIYTGGDLPAYELRGTASLVDTATVILEEETGQAVECSDICSYSMDAQLTDNPDLEPYTNETTCTEEVCRLDAQSSPSPS